MTRGSRFWVQLAVFQVAFGLTIFIATRQYYIQDTGGVQAEPNHAAAPLESPGASASNAEDPDVIALLANEAFGNQQYDRAAELYQQLAVLRPDVNVHNNLGITLHYLGRSTEALEVLDKGVTLDPTYQRIWLTLGFVNSQLGNVDQARAALTKATELDATSDVGQSAAEMLAGLPRNVPNLAGSQ